MKGSRSIGIPVILKMTHQHLWERAKSLEQNSVAEEMENALRFIKLIGSNKTKYWEKTGADSKDKLINSLLAKAGWQGGLESQEAKYLQQLADTFVTTQKGSHRIRTLFWTTHAEGQSMVDPEYFDDIIEQAFSEIVTNQANGVLSSFSSVPLSFQYTATRFASGTSKDANINLTGAFSGLAKGIQQGLADNVVNKLKVSQKRKPKLMNQLINTNLSLQYRKTDVDSNILFEINLSPTNQLQHLQTLFLQHTYSIKNYQQYQDWIQIGKKKIYQDYARLSQIDMSLGHSNLFKAIGGPLTSFYGNTLGWHYFYRLVNSANNNDNIASHFFHLRFAYELTGLGLGFTNAQGQFQELKAVEFLIINNPDTPDIYVLSTGQLINNTLNMKASSNAFQYTMALTRSLEARNINIDKN